MTTAIDQPYDYISSMSLFSTTLREAGICCGLKETQDSCVLLSQMDLTDREAVKTALRIVYASTLREQELFDRVFDRFFISEELKDFYYQKALDEQQRLEQLRKQAEEDLSYNGSPMDIPEDLRETYIRMPEDARERLRKAKDTMKGNFDLNPQLYGDLIHSIFMKSILEQKLLMDDAAAHSDAFHNDELEFIYREISQFKPNEIPKAIEIINSISKQIDNELRAKKKKTGRARNLDFKKTIRKSLETGGALCRLEYKRKHTRHKQLVMLCDISGSMLQFAEFALTFIRSMSSVSDFSRTFLFSEELFEADSFAMQSAASFKDYIKSTGLYGKGTNLATALAELASVRPSVLGPSVTLLILSDTKTVDSERAEALLKDISKECAEMLWLNPIPINRWNHIKSISRFSQICRMLPCSTLRELSIACSGIVSV